MSFLESIKVPTFLINEIIAKNNIQVMVNKAKENKVRFRPHFKTHQSAEIGEWYRAAGVNCITVSSVGMAKYFADAGWRDILIAFPVNLLEINEINKLSKRVRLDLLLDSEDVFQKMEELINTEVGLWIKIDTGYNRAGVLWNDFENTISLARKISASSRMKLKGILTHAGHTYQAQSPKAVLKIFNQTRLRLLDVKEKVEEALGIPIEISIGDTPGSRLASNFSDIDEIRPGNFIFYDVQQYCLGVCTPSEIAVVLACPVVSVYSKRSEALIYGGAIHLSKDAANCSDNRRVYGLVQLPGEEITGLLDQCYVRSLSQEHGIIYMPSQKISQLSPGDLVLVYPPHSCLTLQAMRDVFSFDGERIPTMLSK